MHPEAEIPAKPVSAETALTQEEQARAKIMFDSMGMDGEHVSPDETREMLAQEPAQ